LYNSEENGFRVILFKTEFAKMRKCIEHKIEEISKIKRREEICSLPNSPCGIHEFTHSTESAKTFTCVKSPCTHFKFKRGMNFDFGVMHYKVQCKPGGTLYS